MSLLPAKPHARKGASLRTQHLHGCGLPALLDALLFALKSTTAVAHEGKLTVKKSLFDGGPMLVCGSDGGCE